MLFCGQNLYYKNGSITGNNLKIQLNPPKSSNNILRRNINTKILVKAFKKKKTQVVQAILARKSSSTATTIPVLSLLLKATVSEAAGKWYKARHKPMKQNRIEHPKIDP